ncbi:MAG TPA: YciI family protein [Anaerolineales bacterium]
MKDIQNSGKRFVYFYFNRNEPEKIKQVVPDHVQYWKTAKLKGYIGGPFGDRTGGLISFVVPNLQAAMQIILQDPFIREDLIEEKWVKEWIPE